MLPFIVFQHLIMVDFRLFPNSLMSFADRYFITFTISMLYIIGGIGFFGT